MKTMGKYAYNIKNMSCCLFKMVPQLFVLIILIALIESVLPFINVVATQMMIDGLLEHRSVGKMVSVLAVALALHAALHLISGLLRWRREIDQVKLELEFQKMQSIHEMNLSLMQVESTEIQELKRNIEQAKMRNGGIEKIVSYFEIGVKNILTIIVAGAMFGGVCIGIQRDGRSSTVGFLLPIIGLILVLIISTVIIHKLQAGQTVLVADLNEQANRANGGAFSYIQFISNYHFGKEIRMFSLGSYLCDFFDKLWTSSIGYSIVQRLGKEKAKIPCINVLCNEIITIFVYISAIWQACLKAITIGHVIVYINSVKILFQSIVSMIGLGSELISTGIFLEPYVKLMTIEEENRCEDSDTLQHIPIHEIRFEHVYFKYPGHEHWILEDVSFSLKSLEKMAVVGENGAGKSTLIKLLCRFYEPDRGCIKLNGLDVRTFDKQQYRKIISAVFQDFSLPAFKLGNVISGRDDFDHEKAENALRDVGVMDNAEKWKKETDIFEQYIYQDFSGNGVELSGGEGQKIAIARALYKEAQLMIMDEPTAALDPISESVIFQDFHRLCQEKMCIFISHRLYSCKVCDFILVLEDGKVVQKGTHHELAACNGVYKRLWDAQAILYKDL